MVSLNSNGRVGNCPRDDPAREVLGGGASRPIWAQPAGDPVFVAIPELLDRHRSAMVSLRLHVVCRERVFPTEVDIALSVFRTYRKNASSICRPPHRRLLDRYGRNSFLAVPYQCQDGSPQSISPGVTPIHEQNFSTALLGIRQWTRFGIA